MYRTNRIIRTFKSFIVVYIILVVFSYIFVSQAFTSGMEEFVRENWEQTFSK